MLLKIIQLAGQSDRIPGGRYRQRKAANKKKTSPLRVDHGYVKGNRDRKSPNVPGEGCAD